MHTKEEYIAVFDSGLGGISVLRELLKQLPQERYLYFGDSANAPYGTKSPETVRRLTMEAAGQLMTRGVKALVVACNTATAAAIEDLRQAYPDTIIIGIEPAVKLAADRFTGGHIGIMATPVTLQQEKLSHLVEQFAGLRVSPICAPDLVRLIEQGAGEEALMAYLHPILAPLSGQLDAVVLGCTHYPFAAPVIRRLLGADTQLLDGSEGTARHTRRRLEAAGLLFDGPGRLQMENSSGDPALLQRAMALLEGETP